MQNIQCKNKDMKRNIDVRIENVDSLKAFILSIEDTFEQCQHSDNEKSCGDCMGTWIKNLYAEAPLNQQFSKEEIKLAKEYKKKGFEYCVKDKYDKRALFTKGFPTYNGTSWENASEIIYPADDINLFKYMDGGELYFLDEIINSKKK